jgi:hypothetical protein
MRERTNKKEGNKRKSKHTKRGGQLHVNEKMTEVLQEDSRAKGKEENKEKQDSKKKRLKMNRRKRRRKLRRRRSQEKSEPQRIVV